MHLPPRVLKNVDPAIIDRAISFAKIAHKGQKRKYTYEPYVTHPVAVAEMAASALPNNEDLQDHLVIAILHDVVEDTRYTLDNIRYHFGETVATGVYWLTNTSKQSGLNRANRKIIDMHHINLAPPSIKTIKLADIIHNLKTTIEHDPKFAKTYTREKLSLVTHSLKEGDFILYDKAMELINDYYHDQEIRMAATGMLFPDQKGG